MSSGSGQQVRANDNLGCIHFEQAVFTPDECAQILEMSDQISANEGTMSSAAVSDTSLRDSRVVWFTHED